MAFSHSLVTPKYPVIAATPEPLQKIIHKSVDSFRGANINFKQAVFVAQYTINKNFKSSQVLTILYIIKTFNLQNIKMGQ